MYQILSFFLILLAISSCKTAGSSSEEKHSLTEFRLLNAAEGQKAVVRDSMEFYFDKVNVLEMSIMLQMESPSGERDSVIARYKQMLADDVEDFSAEEHQLLTEVFRKALDLSAKVSANLKLPKINLIKTKGTYYGAGVYYTRENCIVIPAPQLKAANKELLRTLIHEIFHIYTRYNHDKRDALYTEIGYNRIKHLDLSDFLKKRIIYNPDGIDLGYAIEVSDSSGRTFSAIPAIYSKFSSYRMLPLLKSFVFQLFEVQEKDGVWKIINEDVGYSEEQLIGYWEKIGRNTRYTIHPDEVLADNFTFLAMSKESSTELDKFDEKGRELLKKIEAIIQK